MRRFTCQNCHQDVFFDNTHCLECGFQLGYEPKGSVMLSSPDGETFAAGATTLYPCANRAVIACNWLTDTPGSLCTACRHNQVIPDLTVAEHATLWSQIEKAKRVLFYSLIAWDLPLETKVEAPETGLAFDFLADQQQPDGSVDTHLTGHASGLITINIAEGDDAERERRRLNLGEPYRTLVGHFRHEVGHYFFERLVRPDADRLARCRALFGNDELDYAEALKQHYDNGPPADWRAHFITPYASAHPFEDFAETFAHYVHMVDGLETAAAFGVKTDTASAAPTPYRDGTVRELVEAWVPVTVAVNAVNRSMGQPDLYPFVLSDAVHDKLAFVHDLVRPAMAHVEGAKGPVRSLASGLFGFARPH